MLDDAPPWPATAGPEEFLPAIVQDADSGAVRMLAWMNSAAYAATVASGRATFWSRSHGRLWEKGESSGNRLDVVGLRWDCDQDALLVAARAAGPTCHTGSETCWGEPRLPAALGPTLERLARTIAARDRDRPAGSYTARLLAAGPARPAAKLLEEAGEAAAAALGEGPERLAEEAADVLYHLLVLLQAGGVEPGMVAERLTARERPAARPEASEGHTSE